MMAAAVELLKPAPALELIWASPRELLNVFQADAVGCQVITVTNDILKKLSLVATTWTSIRWTPSRCSTTTAWRPASSFEPHARTRPPRVLKTNIIANYAARRWWA